MNSVIDEYERLKVLANEYILSVANSMSSMSKPALRIDTKCPEQMVKECKQQYHYTHYSCNIKRDYVWLSPFDIEHLQVKYASVFDEMNKTYNLSTKRFEREILKDTNGFLESLFMLYMYLLGEVWSYPLQHSVDVDYIIESTPILIQLCIRGIYTLDGTLPKRKENNNVTHMSSYTFCVMINDHNRDEFVLLLRCLYDRGVNVFARQHKNMTSVQEWVYKKDSVRLPSFRKHDNILRDFGMAGIFSRSIWPSARSREYEKKECELSEYYSLYYIHIWNDTHVEDVLLQLWLEYNSKFGMLNNYGMIK